MFINDVKKNAQNTQVYEFGWLIISLTEMNGTDTETCNVFLSDILC